eukprot:6184463-Pleurochrysis_carterae.AAC.1
MLLAVPGSDACAARVYIVQQVPLDDRRSHHQFSSRYTSREITRAWKARGSECPELWMPKGNQHLSAGPLSRRITVMLTSYCT